MVPALLGACQGEIREGVDGGAQVCPHPGARNL